MREPQLIAALRDYFVATSIYPQPQLALGASIAFLGALYSHRTQGYTGLRSNVYVLGVAPSGSGKNHAIKMIKLLLYKAQANELIMGAPVSSAGILTPLHKNEGRGLILWDEIGEYLEIMMDIKAPAYAREISATLTELATSSDQVFYGRQYANRDGKNERRDIVQPCLSVLGQSNFKSLRAAMTGKNSMNGFLSRWLIFKEHVDYPSAHDYKYCDFPLQDWLNDIFSREASVSQDKEPPKAHYSDLAFGMLRDFAGTIRQSMNDNNCEAYRSIYARCAENAHKLALIAQDRKGFIDEHAVFWAQEIAKSNADMLYKSSMELGEEETPYSKVQNKILSAFSEIRGGLTKTDLWRATRSIPLREREAAIQDLIDMGMLIAKELKTGGRPQTFYALNQSTSEQKE